MEDVFLSFYDSDIDPGFWQFGMRQVNERAVMAIAWELLLVSDKTWTITI